MCPPLPYPLPLSEFLIAPSAPLKLVPCPDCQGDSECSRCGSKGEIEVCGQCLQVPELVCGVEACACTYPLAAASTCEVCELPAETNEGLCRSCFCKGIEKVLEEEDPELAHYYYLRDFDLPADLVEREMAWAAKEGWL